jgi:hypothetical protein
VDPIGESINELFYLSIYLPLGQITDFGLFFEHFDIDTSEEQSYFRMLCMAISTMRFRSLETFHFGLGCDASDVPLPDLWVRRTAHLPSIANV